MGAGTDSTAEMGQGAEGSFAPGCVIWMEAGRLAQQEEAGCKGSRGNAFSPTTGGGKQ